MRISGSACPLNKTESYLAASSKSRTTRGNRKYDTNSSHVTSLESRMKKVEETCL